MQGMLLWQVFFLAIPKNMLKIVFNVLV